MGYTCFRNLKLTTPHTLYKTGFGYSSFSVQSIGNNLIYR